MLKGENTVFKWNNFSYNNLSENNLGKIYDTEFQNFTCTTIQIS